MTSSEQLLLLSPTRRQAKMLISQPGRDPTSRRAAQEAYLHQIRFVYIFYGITLFASGRGNRFDAHGSPIKLLDYDAKEPAIRVVQALLVDLQHRKAVARHSRVDRTIGLDLSVVAHSSQHPVRDPRRAS